MVTPGPWEAIKETGFAESYVRGPDNTVVADMLNTADAVFIAETRDKVPQLETWVEFYKMQLQDTEDTSRERGRRIRRAMQMHREHDCRKDPCTIGNINSPLEDCVYIGECHECQKPYPCPTRTTLTGEDV